MTRGRGAPRRSRRLSAAAVLAVILTGCTTPENTTPIPQLTVARPTPEGMTEQPPDRATPDKVDTSCDPTASLRPTNDNAANDAAVAEIRKRGRLIVGLDVGSNLFSFRDPITGELTGFDVDIAGEVARDIFGSPERVDYRILSSADRIAALRNSTVDIVVKTMSITCERRKEVNFSTVYLMTYQRILTSRDSGITNAQGLSGKRVCAALGTTSLNRVAAISPPPVIMSVVTWADCLVALQQRQIDAVSTDDSILAGLMSQDPYLHIIGPNMSNEPYGIGINLQNAALVRFVNRTLERIRRDGTWSALYRKWLSVLGPTPAPPSAKYSD